MKKRAYQFIRLKYIHDVLTEEFVNIGLIMLFGHEKLLLSQFNTSSPRMINFFPDIELNAYHAAIEAIENGVKDIQERIDHEEGFFHESHNILHYALKILPHDDSSLQWSHTGNGLLSSGTPEKIFSHLYHRFVLKYEDEQKNNEYQQLNQ